MTALNANDIHVWVIGPPHGDELNSSFERHLSSEELDRAKRFNAPEHARRWSYFRASMRRILGHYLGLPPQALVFEYEENGKPRLLLADSQQALHFNLSHSGELALLAVTRAAPVGVDIELVKSLEDMDALASNVFSRDELKAYFALSRAQRPAGFFRAWTRKEAVIKAIGVGLFVPLDRFDVSLAPLTGWHLPRVRQPLSGELDYPVFAFAAAPGYEGAVALCVPGYCGSSPPMVRVYS